MYVDSGIEAVGAVSWGTHFCQFYETPKDLVDTLVPFFRAGLANEERCMWVTAQPLRAGDAADALRNAVPDLDRRLARGQIEIGELGDGLATGHGESKELGRPLTHRACPLGEKPMSCSHAERLARERSGNAPLNPGYLTTG